MKNKKTLIFLFILILFVSVGSVFYIYISDMKNPLNRYMLLGFVCINILLVRMIYHVNRKNYKEAQKNNASQKIVHIDDKKETIILNDFENINHQSSDDKVALLHLDIVNENDKTIKLYKNKISMLDVVNKINKEK